MVYVSISILVKHILKLILVNRRDFGGDSVRNHLHFWTAKIVYMKWIVCARNVLTDHFMDKTSLQIDFNEILEGQQRYSSKCNGDSLIENDQMN